MNGNSSRFSVMLRKTGDILECFQDTDPPRDAPRCGGPARPQGRCSPSSRQGLEAGPWAAVRHLLYGLEYEIEAPRRPFHFIFPDKVPVPVPLYLLRNCSSLSSGICVSGRPLRLVRRNENVLFLTLVSALLLPLPPPPCPSSSAWSSCLDRWI